MSLFLLNSWQAHHRSPVNVHGKGGHGRVVAAEVGSELGAGTDDREGTRPVEPFICAIGDNAARKRIGGQVSVFSPCASVADSGLVDVGPGSFVATRAHLGPRVTIGRGCIINTGAIVEHDCVVGDYVHVSSGAVLCGGVTVGEGAMVGAGAVAKPGITIGAWATVGCGAVVVKDVPDSETWVGNPARKLR